MSSLTVLWRSTLSAVALFTWLGYAPSSALAEDGAEAKSTSPTNGGDQVRHQLAEMGKKADELEKAGNFNDAEHIHHAMRELYTKTFGSAHPNAKSGEAGPNRDQIRQHLAEMGKKAEELEKAGNHEDAEHIHHAMRELYTKAFGNAQPEVKSGEAGPNRDQVRHQIAEMGKKAEELEKGGNHEDAEHIHHAMRELYTKAFGNAHPEASSGMPSPETEKLRQRIASLKQQIEDAERAGNADVVERLHHQMQEVVGKLYPQRNPSAIAGSSRAMSSNATVESRIQKLKAAAENLHAAGFDGEAQHIAQMVDHLRAEGARAGRSTDPTSGPNSAYHPHENAPELASARLGGDFGPISTWLRDVKNISPEQKEKLSKLVKSYMPRMHEAKQKASEASASEDKSVREKAHAEAESLTKEMRGKVMDLLTPEQREEAAR